MKVFSIKEIIQAKIEKRIDHLLKQLEVVAEEFDFDEGSVMQNAKQGLDNKATIKKARRIQMELSLLSGI